MEGLISTIQGYSLRDGPGIRSTVFTMGCALRCQYCSNPELLEMKIRTMELNNTSTKVGKWISSEELAKKLFKDKIFYTESKGGVTFSGGECLLQSDFVYETAKLLKEEDISIAIDTSLYVPRQNIEKVLPVVDLFLVDIKAIDDTLHQKVTSQSNRLILENLMWLKTQPVELWIRLVLVGNLNDDLEDVKKRFNFIQELGQSVTRVDVLCYHNLGLSKYKGLNMTCSLSNDAFITKEYLHKLKTLIARYDFDIRIEGEE